MRNFGAADKMTKMMEKFGMKEGEELSHPLLNRSVQTAQKRVEQRNYQMRKRVLDFDDVMNNHREVVYEYRNEVIASANPREIIFAAIDESVPNKVLMFLEDPDPDNNPDYAGVINWANSNFPIGLHRDDQNITGKDPEEVSDFLIGKIKEIYELKVQHEEPAHLDNLERSVVLGSIDRLWQEHLYNMDALREGVGLRAHGQKDPLIEYKTEAYTVFKEVWADMKAEILINLFRSTTNIEAFQDFLRNLPMNQGRGNDESPAIGQSTNAANAPQSSDPELEPQITIPVTRSAPKVGRNEPCPCGSGKKFKQCCGRGG
jgi:preprotein translocase subunit SecA